MGSRCSQPLANAPALQRQFPGCSCFEGPTGPRREAAGGSSQSSISPGISLATHGPFGASVFPAVRALASPHGHSAPSSSDGQETPIGDGGAHQRRPEDPPSFPGTPRSSRAPMPGRALHSPAFRTHRPFLPGARPLPGQAPSCSRPSPWISTFPGEGTQGQRSFWVEGFSLRSICGAASGTRRWRAISPLVA